MSSVASNVVVNISANGAALAPQLAKAEQQVKGWAARIRSAASKISLGGEVGKGLGKAIGGEKGGALFEGGLARAGGIAAAAYGSLKVLDAWTAINSEFNKSYEKTHSIGESLKATAKSIVPALGAALKDLPVIGGLWAYGSAADVKEAAAANDAANKKGMEKRRLDQAKTLKDWADRAAKLRDQFELGRRSGMQRDLFQIGLERRDALKQTAEEAAAAGSTAPITKAREKLDADLKRSFALKEIDAIKKGWKGAFDKMRDTFADGYKKTREQISKHQDELKKIGNEERQEREKRQAEAKKAADAEVKRAEDEAKKLEAAMKMKAGVIAAGSMYAGGGPVGGDAMGAWRQRMADAANERAYLAQTAMQAARENRKRYGSMDAGSDPAVRELKKINSNTRQPVVPLVA